MHPTVLSRREAANELGLTDHTITRYLARGWLTGVRVGRRWFIHRASIERLLREGRPLGGAQGGALADAEPVGGGKPRPDPAQR